MRLRRAGGLPGRRLARQAEVENLHLPVVEQEDVLRLEIAMDDALAVRRGEAARDLHGDIDGLANGQRRRCSSASRSVSPASSSMTT